MVVIYTHDAALIFSTNVTNMGTNEADNDEDIMTKDKEKKRKESNNTLHCVHADTQTKTPLYSHPTHLSKMLCGQVTMYSLLSNQMEAKVQRQLQNDAPAVAVDSLSH